MFTTTEDYKLQESLQKMKLHLKIKPKTNKPGNKITISYISHIIYYNAQVFLNKYKFQINISQLILY